jgi:hypothetical protein
MCSGFCTATVCKAAADVCKIRLDFIDFVLAGIILNFLIQFNLSNFKEIICGEPLWLSGKVVKYEKINEIESTRVRSPPRVTSLKKNNMFS